MCIFRENYSVGAWISINRQCITDCVDNHKTNRHKKIEYNKRIFKKRNETLTHSILFLAIIHFVQIRFRAFLIPCHFEYLN